MILEINGRLVFVDELPPPRLPDISDLVIVAATLIVACVGFLLWRCS